LVCELLCVGTELLLGDILNTNAQFLSREMAALGIAVLHQSTVGDNPLRLREALETALERSDIVLTSGGLGPTADDITREIACEVMGEALLADAEILAKLEAFFTARGSRMTDNNKKQALVPQNGRVLENHNGTAPGICMEKNGKCLILLPGPPRELEPMFRESVKPLLQKYADGVILSHTVHTMLLGESAMEARVRDLMDSANPTVAPYAKSGEAYLRVSAKAADLQQAERIAAPVLQELQARLGNAVYGLDCGSIEIAVVRLLAEKGKTLAVAESCTGGYLAKRITDIPGASQVFACGIVSYSNDIKRRILGVRAQTLEAYSAVSEQVACEMAQRVRQIGGADIGLAATGYAGPGEGAGLSYIAIDSEDGTRSECIQTGRTQDRDYNRYVSASRALNLVRLFLQGA